MIICLVIGLGVLLTGIDPVQLTELSVVFSAIALPLTYLPILIVANDPEYMGVHVNGRMLNRSAWSTWCHTDGRLGRGDPAAGDHGGWLVSERPPGARPWRAG